MRYTIICGKTAAQNSGDATQSRGLWLVDASDVTVPLKGSSTRQSIPHELWSDQNLQTRQILLCDPIPCSKSKTMKKLGPSAWFPGHPSWWQHPSRGQGGWKWMIAIWWRFLWFRGDSRLLLEQWHIILNNGKVPTEINWNRMNLVASWRHCTNCWLQHVLILKKKEKLAKYPSRTRQGVAKQTGYCWIWPADDLLISWDKVWRSTYLRYHRSVVLRHTHMTSKHVFNYTHLDCLLHHLNVIICLLSTIRRLFFVRTNHVTAKPRRAIFVFVCVIFSLLTFKLINET